MSKATPPEGWEEARRIRRDRWEANLRARNIDVSVTDAYTDGFFDGAAWAKGPDLPDQGAVSIHPYCRGGAPCIEQRPRFPLAQIFIELADDHDLSINALAQDFDIAPEQLKKALEWAAAYFDQSFLRRCPAMFGTEQCEYPEGHDGNHGTSTQGFTTVADD